MSHTYWFATALTCLDCGSSAEPRRVEMYSSGLNPEAGDEWVAPGQILPIGLWDFDDAYFTLRYPNDVADVRVIEQWTCTSCNHVQWAQLEFHREDAQHYRFVGAHAVVLTPEILQHMHYVSRRMDMWLADNPGPKTDALVAVIGHLFK